jgi:hypothetical protein
MSGGSKIRFDRIPVLAEHISVPPHSVVTSASHKYSFNQDGSEVCFHSPQALPEGSVSLSSFLEKVSDGFLEGGEKINPDEPSRILNELIGEVYGDQEKGLQPRDFGGDDPLGRWFAWGDHLRTEYAIEQFALVRWKDEGDMFW